MIYLDNAATAPLLTSARLAMDEAWQNWANPGATYKMSVKNSDCLHKLRQRMRDILGTSDHVVFTASSSEANNLVLHNARFPILVSKFEHPSVKNIVGSKEIELSDLEGYLKQGQHLVSVTAVQHEIGMMLDVKEILRLVKKYHSKLHIDASQAKYMAPFLEADYITLSSHKIGGPVGVAALITRNLVESLIVGGAQEQNMRAGTQAIPLIAGFVAALEEWHEGGYFKDHFKKLKMILRDRVDAKFFLESKVHANFVDYITCLVVPIPGSEVAAFMDLNNIAIGLGSACTAGTLNGIAALKQFGLIPSHGIRVSFGLQTSEADVETFAEKFNYFIVLR